MDKFASVPFTFQLYGNNTGLPKVETSVNTATNEQFSVSNNNGIIEIKRTRDQKEKGKNFPTITMSKVNRSAAQGFLSLSSKFSSIH